MSSTFVCSVVRCPHRFRSSKSSNIPHKFPEDSARRDEWIKALKGVMWVPSPNSVICSFHFEKSCYDPTSEVPILLPDALPTIFSSCDEENSYVTQQNHENRKLETAVERQSSMDLPDFSENDNSDGNESTEPIQIKLENDVDEEDSVLIAYLKDTDAKSIASTSVDELEGLILTLKYQTDAYSKLYEATRKELKSIRQKHARNKKRINGIKLRIHFLKYGCYPPQFKMELQNDTSSDSNT